VRRAVGLACVAATLLAGCTSSGDGSGSGPEGTDGDRSGRGSGPTTTTTAPGPTVEPVLDDAPCPEAGTDAARVGCSVLVVPEDPDRPAERQVELAVLRVRPAADLVDPAADVTAPVVYLHGGPGGAATPQWGVFQTVADALGRDVYLYDQRGGGASSPTLTCPEHDRALLAALTTTDAPSTERGRVGDALAACHERLGAEGVDLDQYDLDRSVQDLESLRRAIGAPRLTLVATSFGTRLARRYLQLHPTRVAAMALDGVDVTDPRSTDLATLAEDAVDRLVDDCAADPACRGAHPDLRGTLERALAAFDRSPVGMALAATDTTPAATLQVTGDDLHAALFAAMYDTLVLPVIPTVIEQLADGDLGAVAVATQRVGASLFGTAIGARMSVECAAGDPLPGDRPVRDRATEDEATKDPDGGRASTLELSAAQPFCDRWPLGGPSSDESDESDAAERAARVPTLVVAGELDPITPAADATAFSEAIDATLVLLPRAGHAAMLTERCGLRSLRAFLQSPGELRSAGCDP
jgi:pimeloyl-ACP methyl ester carboxylesterase